MRTAQWAAPDVQGRPRWRMRNRPFVPLLTRRRATTEGRRWSALRRRASRRAIDKRLLTSTHTVCLPVRADRACPGELSRRALRARTGVIYRPPRRRRRSAAYGSAELAVLIDRTHVGTTTCVRPRRRRQVSSTLR